MNAGPDPMQALTEQARACTACRLATSRTQVVWADGNPGARLVIIGEGPGGDEDRLGVPFVGQAGQLLDQILGAVQLDRTQVYITNVVKCRPPGNRTPEPDETHACDRWLLPQLALLRPQVILTLGNTPTRHLLPHAPGITRARGTWHRWRHPHADWEAWLLPMFHPAYLLRNPTRVPGGPKSLTWHDIQDVKAVLSGEKTPVAAGTGSPSDGLF